MPLLLVILMGLFITSSSHFLLSPSLNGHLFWGSLNFKLFTLFLLLGAILLCCLHKNFCFTKNGVGDLVLFHSFLFLFTPLIFISNTLMSFIFVVELVSLLIFVLIVLWDSFWRGSGKRWVSQRSPSVASTPFPFHALFFFFWTSFVVTIALFYTLNAVLTLYGSGDWSLIEVLISLDASSYYRGSWIYLLLLFVIGIFIKSALAPFFFWKPIFFSALFTTTLLVYILFFYPLLFTWMAVWWFTLNPLLTFTLFPLLTFILGLGLVITLSILSLPSKFRNLLAISSILNTLLVWFAFNPVLPYYTHL